MLGITPLGTRPHTVPLVFSNRGTKRGTSGLVLVIGLLSYYGYAFTLTHKLFE